MALKSYLQLIRLPNIFTAAADSLAGWLLVTGSFEDVDRGLPLVLASACTYAGGIVLNDVFDFATDRIERPGRPLPSGRIGRRVAAMIGAALLAMGMALVLVAGTTYGWLVELALIACILAYDAGVKRSPLGPEVMGACRGLNLLLGMSHAAALGGPVAWFVATAYAVFVTGITWISRSEVHSGLSRNIAAGLSFQLVAFIAFVAAVCASSEFPDPAPASLVRVTAGVALLVAIGLGVISRTGRAAFGTRSR